VVHSSRRRFQREKERDSENSESSKSASRGLCVSLLKKRDGDLSVPQKKVARLLILGLGTLNIFFCSLFLVYAFFPFFPSKLVLTKRMRAFNNKEKEEDL